MNKKLQPRQRQLAHGRKHDDRGSGTVRGMCYSSAAGWAAIQQNTSVQPLHDSVLNICPRSQSVTTESARFHTHTSPFQPSAEHKGTTILTSSLNTKSSSSHPNGSGSIESTFTPGQSGRRGLMGGRARQHVLHLDLLWFTRTRAHVGKWIKPPGRGHAPTAAAHSQSKNSVSAFSMETNKGLPHYK